MCKVSYILTKLKIGNNVSDEIEVSSFIINWILNI